MGDLLDAYTVLVLEAEPETDWAPELPVGIIEGDCRDVLRELPDACVQTVVTSPPYFGLRDYGTGEWSSGDENCDHVKGELRRGVNLANSVHLTRGGAKKIAEVGHVHYGAVCERCGAVRTDRQLGLEPTPAEFVDALVGVFREVRRVLRDDGTVWLNLGDSYASHDGGGWRDGNFPSSKGWEEHSARNRAGTYRAGGVKAKDLFGIPWMIAFALRDDGWYLRSDIVWSKPNPMPESVTDRPTKSHEYVFLLAKSRRYFYDAEAIRDEFVDERNGRDGSKLTRVRNVGGRTDGFTTPNGWAPPPGRAGKNKRTVWTIPSRPFPGAHFATFPPALVEPCVLAGSSARGACERCGAPWQRVSEKSYRSGPTYKDAGDETTLTMGRNRNVTRLGDGIEVTTVGWEPTCECGAGVVPCVVLDPFAGAGTVGVVAGQLDRHFIGVELKPDYAALARDRITKEGRPGNRKHEPPKVLAGQMEMPT